MTCRRERHFHVVIVGLALFALAACDSSVEPPAPLAQARFQLANNDPLGAEILLEGLVESGTPRREVAAYLGEAELLQGDPEQARQWLEPGDFSAETRQYGFRLLGRLELEEGNLPAAGRAFDNALAINASNSGLWVDIGRLRYRGGEQFQALAAAERAIVLDPDNPEAVRFRGQLLRDSKGLEPGSRWFAGALQRFPDNAELRVELAATLGDMGQAATALKVLRGGQVSGGAGKRMLFVEAVLAARGGDFGLAHGLLRRTGMVERRVPSALMLSVLIDCADENFASASETLEALLKAQPDNRRVQELMAYTLAERGAELELVERFSGAAARPDGSTYLRTLVGRAYEALDNRVEASRFLDLAARSTSDIQLLAVSGAGASAMLTLRDKIRADLGRQDFQTALYDAETFSRLSPGSGDAMSLLGDVRFARGDRAGAVSAYARSAVIRQPWPLMARRVASESDRAASVGLLEAFVRSNPMDSDAAVVLANAYTANGNLREATLLLDHALANGQGRSPIVLAARSAVAAKSGDRKAALDFALEAHALQPLSAVTTATLIAALPDEQAATRNELRQKLASLLGS